MNKVLITGCNGLIGSTLMNLLSQNNSFEVFGIGRSQSNRINVIKLDLSEDWSSNALPEKIDVVIHLAQSEKFRDFPNSAKEVFNVNTISTLKLLDYAKNAGAKKFIYASSGGVYGNSDIGFNEDSPILPNKDLGFYLTTKFSSELLVANYVSFFSVNILRFFFVYGPKQKKNMLIPRLIESVTNGSTITLQGLEGIRINPIYVEDAAQAITKIMQDPSSQNINIGGNEIVSLKEICDIIGKEIDKQPHFEIQDTEVKHLIGDVTKMKSFYVPKISIREGIIRMLKN